VVDEIMNINELLSVQKRVNNLLNPRIAFNKADVTGLKTLAINERLASIAKMYGSYVYGLADLSLNPAVFEFDPSPKYEDEYHYVVSERSGFSNLRDYTEGLFLVLSFAADNVDSIDMSGSSGNPQVNARITWLYDAVSKAANGYEGAFDNLVRQYVELGAVLGFTDEEIENGYRTRVDESLKDVSLPELLWFGNYMFS